MTLMKKDLASVSKAEGLVTIEFYGSNAPYFDMTIDAAELLREKLNEVLDSYLTVIQWRDRD